MMIKKFIADTYYEAFVMAQDELGKDMVVVTMKKIQKKSWGGLYTQEQVELTAAAQRAETRSKEKAPPTRPIPTEEISSHPQIPRSLHPAAPPRTTSPDLPVFSAPVPPPPTSLRSSKPVTPALPKARQFSLREDAYLRTSHTLRSNQEGDLDPISQRVERTSHTLRPQPDAESDPFPQRIEEEQKRTRKMQHFLDRIIQQKEETPDLPPRMPAKSVPPPTTSDPNAETLHAIQDQINGLTQLLQTFKKRSQSALDSSARQLPPGLARIRENLLRMETPCELAQEIIATLADTLPAAALETYSQTRKGVTDWLRKTIRLCPETSIGSGTNGQEILVLMGPTGVGKTTTIAKLAASFALNVVERKSVALLTLDTFRIGAPSQLSQYAQIIEAGMEIILEPGDIPGALERHADKDVILVDTAGRCQKNRTELDELKEFLSSFPRARRYLVLSSVTKFSDMMDTYRKFSEVGFDQLIFTKIDETNSLGPLLGVLVKTGLPLAYLTHGQSVPDDFRHGNLEFLLTQLVPEE